VLYRLSQRPNWVEECTLGNGGVANGQVVWFRCCDRLIEENAQSAYRFSASCQFTITVMLGGAAPSTSTDARK
jgi:hypothetical protein